jgi:hypothetical protein
MKNEGYAIKILADGEVLFKLLSLKHAEELLNEHFPLNHYCSNGQVREIVISISAISQFSLSAKPEKTFFKQSTGTLTYQVNLDLENLKQMSNEEIQEDFFMLLIDLLENTNIVDLDSKKLTRELIHFFQ